MAQSGKKPVKKLVITDANEVSEPKVAPDKEGNIPETTKVGDTPPVVAAPEVAKKTSIKVIHDDEPGQAHEVAETEILADELPKEITIADAIAASEEIEKTIVPPEEPQTDEIQDEEGANNDTDLEVVEDEPSVEDALADETKQEPESAAEPVPELDENEEFADKEIVEAVDDIVAKEGDALLEKEDEEIRRDVAPKKEAGLKTVFKNWWKNPATKWGTIVGIAILLLVIGLLPATRYAILNMLGVRASSSLTVINNESLQPLKNAEVTMGDQKTTTDDDGKASFSNLKLGKTALKVVKRGYATVEQSRVLGWGSNPLGNIGMSVSGSQYTFIVKDVLSAKAIVTAEAVSGDFNAQADNDGKIVLPIDANNDKDIEVTIKADGYREEKLTIKQDASTEINVSLVAGKKHVFVSKRSGKYDIYSIYADGKNESLILAGTGSESDYMTLLPHPTKDVAALVSTREGKRNKDGYLLSSLFMLNVKDGSLTKVIQSERVQLVDWTGDRIVFIAVTEGASAANPARSKLYSFELGQPGPKEIATANYFNDAVLFNGAIYYAPSSYAIPAASVKFYKVNPDGSGLATVLDKEVWNIFRYDYGTLHLSVAQDWYELKTTGSPTKLASNPANPVSRTFRDSQDRKRSLWVDSRDGKGVLLSYDIAAKTDSVLHTQAGLMQPVYWLSNNTYVFRISDSREVADYVKNIDGGDAKKLRDVTNTDTSNYFN